MHGVFQHVKGVRRVMSGYSGGSTPTEAYDAVSSGRSRHAESVKISHAPSQAGYGALPQIFFSVVHDPTQPIAKTRTQAPNTARPSLPTTPTIKDGPGTCGPAQCSASFQPAHRDVPGRQAQLLSGGGLPPGLSGGEPAYINASKPPRRQGAQAFDARAYKVFVAHLGAGAPHRAKMAATLVHEDSEYVVNF